MCQQILGKIFNVILQGSNSSGSRRIIRRQTGTGVGNEGRAECKSRVFATLCFESAEMRTTTFIIRKYWVRNVTHILNNASLISWFLYESYVAFAAKQMKGKAGHICVPLVNWRSTLVPHAVNCVRKVIALLSWYLVLKYPDKGKCAEMLEGEVTNEKQASSNLLRNWRTSGKKPSVT